MKYKCIATVTEAPHLSSSIENHIQTIALYEKFPFPPHLTDADASPTGSRAQTAPDVQRS